MCESFVTQSSVSELKKYCGNLFIPSWMQNEFFFFFLDVRAAGSDLQLCKHSLSLVREKEDEGTPSFYHIYKR